MAKDSQSLPTTIVLLGVLLGFVASCRDNGKAEPGLEHELGGARLAPEVELAAGARRLTAQEESRYVSASAQIVCLRPEHPRPLPPSPELLDHAANVVVSSDFDIGDFAAVTTAYRGNERSEQAIANAAMEACGVSAIKGLDVIVEGVAIRRLRARSAAGDLPRGETQGRYVQAAKDLACVALSGSGDPSVERAKVLSDNGFDETSFEATGRSLRDDPSVLAAIAEGVRECVDDDGAD